MVLRVYLSILGIHVDVLAFNVIHFSRCFNEVILANHALDEKIGDYEDAIEETTNVSDHVEECVCFACVLIFLL